MTEKRDGYEVVPFPRMRQLIVDAGRWGSRKHMVHGLVEVDVTMARRHIRDHRAKTGESLSFTAFVAGCLARAVDKDRSMHAYRNWRNQLVIFDEVDVLTIVEIEVGDRTFPLAHILRAANKKTLRDIHEEIRSIQAEPESSQSWERHRGTSQRV